MTTGVTTENCRELDRGSRRNYPAGVVDRRARTLDRFAIYRPYPKACDTCAIDRLYPRHNCRIRSGHTDASSLSFSDGRLLFEVILMTVSRD
jgi:hypothetical protein